MMNRMTLPKAAIGVFAISGLVACNAADSSSEAAEYVEPSLDMCEALQGENIVLTVPFSPGGGYDSYARMIAPTLGEIIGTDVVVENQDGAGGLLAMNNLITADNDGTEIAIMNGIGTGGAALADADGVNFALDDLSYIGRVAGDAQMIVVNPDSEFEDWEDVESASDFGFGSTGPGASDFVTPSILISIFDLNAQLVAGFAGSSEVSLSLAQGDVDGMTGTLDSVAASIESGDQRALLAVDSERAEIAPDTPTLGELDLNDEQQVLADAHINLIEMGRPLIGPPDMDPEALACLRAALEESVNDPDLLETSEQAGRPLNYLSGEVLTETVESLREAPEEYLTELREAYETSD